MADRHSPEPDYVGPGQLMLAMIIAAKCSVAGALVGILLALEFSVAETVPAIVGCSIGSIFGLWIVETFEGIPVSTCVRTLASPRRKKHEQS